MLIRVTRNCPWNRCSFCSVYKGSSFSVRKVDDVKADIDAVYHNINNLKRIVDSSGRIFKHDLIDAQSRLSNNEKQAFHAALTWYVNGANSVFLQDANSVVIKPKKLIDILEYLKTSFPSLKRVTSYGRSHTIARISSNNLASMRRFGLNRLHVGLESGSDKVLEMVNKGCNKNVHIKAGRAVKSAGIQLSEYFMPGLGGKHLSREHALETADVLNKINPDFIRLRTLHVQRSSKLFSDWKSGKFKKASGLEIAREIRLFLEKLDGITSQVVSDHMLNLFEEVNGKLPEDKEKMLSVIDSFTELSTNNQCLYQVGRKIGVFRFLSDMCESEKVDQVYEFCRKNNIDPDNIDSTFDGVFRKFI